MAGNGPGVPVQPRPGGGQPNVVPRTAPPQGAPGSMGGMGRAPGGPPQGYPMPGSALRQGPQRVPGRADGSVKF